MSKFAIALLLSFIDSYSTASSKILHDAEKIYLTNIHDFLLLLYDSRSRDG